MKKILNWIKVNRKEFIILLFILFIASFVRLFKIGDYMTFLGDEGRDAIIVRRLLVNFDPILIGPGTSIGNMYLGPLYYYLMAPFLLLFNFSPVGPSVMVAIFGVATVFLVWFLAREWFGKEAAVVSSLLYALSPVIIVYSRSSWNPNIMPFFAILTIFSLWKAWSEYKYVWFIVAGISFAFVLQSHYLGLLLFPTILLLWFLGFRNIGTAGSEKRNFWRNSMFGVLIFLFLMSPLLFFDIRHNWMNFRAMKTFFTERQTTVSIKPWKSIPNLYPIFRDSIANRILSGTNTYVGKISLYAIFFAIIVSFTSLLVRIEKAVKSDEKKYYPQKGFLVLFLWVGFGLIGLGLYKQHLYDHYFGFMFPALFLFIGGVYQKIYDMKFDGLKIIATAWIILMIGSYIVYSPLRGVPNHQMYRAQEVAKFIKADADGSKFNLAVIAIQNYEDGYQYFLEKDGANVSDIDAQNLQNTVGEYLYVVCEISEDKCDPTHSPKAEIANFGWSRVDNKWGIAGVTVYKLAHAS